MAETISTDVDTSLYEGVEGVSPRVRTDFRVNEGLYVLTPLWVSIADVCIVMVTGARPLAAAVRLISPAFTVLLTNTLFTPHSTGNEDSPMKLVNVETVCGPSSIPSLPFSAFFLASALSAFLVIGVAIPPSNLPSPHR